MFTANRVAAIAGFLTSLAAMISALSGVLPAQWQDATVAAVGVIGQVVVVLHFLTGSQKYDALINQLAAQKNPDARKPLSQLEVIEARDKTPPVFSETAAGTPEPGSE